MVLASTSLSGCRLGKACRACCACCAHAHCACAWVPFADYHLLSLLCVLCCRYNEACQPGASSPQVLGSFRPGGGKSAQWVKLHMVIQEPAQPLNEQHLPSSMWAKAGPSGGSQASPSPAQPDVVVVAVCYTQQPKKAARMGKQGGKGAAKGEGVMPIHVHIHKSCLMMWKLHDMFTLSQRLLGVMMRGVMRIHAHTLDD